MIQATIITSYCLQGQLLTSYLYFLRAKLILQPVRPIEWMKVSMKSVMYVLTAHLTNLRSYLIIINTTCRLTVMLHCILFTMIVMDLHYIR